MTQIHPEKRESLVLSLHNTNPIMFVIFISLFCDLMYERGYEKVKYLRD